MPRSLTDQMNLFARLPFQQAPDFAVRYAGTLGSDQDPREARAVLREAACRRLLPRILETFEAEGELDAHDPETVLRDLIQAADLDGYDFARNLERLGWHGLSGEFVDLLEDYAVIADQVREGMLQAWVTANAITLDLPTGTRVRDTARTRAVDDGPRLGTVVAHRGQTAEYIVQFDEERSLYAGTTGGEIVAHHRLARLDS